VRIERKLLDEIDDAANFELVEEVEDFD